MADAENEVIAEKAEQHLSFNVEIDPQYLEKIAKSILLSTNEDRNVKLAPMVVYTDKDYATYVEFGTRPARNADPGGYREKRKKMGEWLGNASKQHDYHYNTDPAKALSKMMAYINKHGTPPRPYIRPALRAMENRPTEDISASMESGNSAHELLKPVAQELCDKIVTNLKDNLGKTGQPIKADGLEGSFKVRAVDISEWEFNPSTLSLDIKGGLTENSLWANKADMGVDNKFPRRG